MSQRLGQELGRIAVLFSSLYVVQEYGAAVSMTVGPSMMPTFNSHGDIVVVNRSMQARSCSCFVHMRRLIVFSYSFFLITSPAML